MRCNFTPYEGKEKYIFVSYAHKDGDRVKPILEKLHEAGFRIWYDEDIEWGTKYSASIAEHIKKCGVCLAFHSKNSVNSDNCKHEIKYSLKYKKGILSVYFEKVLLSAGIAIGLFLYRETFRYQYSDENEGLFLEKLMRAEILQSCKAESAKDKIVKFHDADFEKAFRKRYGIKGDITEKTILGFRKLNLNWCKLHDISDIAMFRGLTYLDLGCNQIRDITPLAMLRDLTWLGLYGNNISDLMPLAGLVNLTALWLEDNQISNIMPLAGLVNLTGMDLGDNKISDIMPLAGLVNLTELNLWSNQISDTLRHWLKARLSNTIIYW